MDTLDFLAGRKILEEADSQYNGKVTVVSELGWGVQIKVGGLPQSGGLAKKIWEKSLGSVKRLTKHYPPSTVLILGFAGGGIAQIARKNWPECEIYGVDIDSVMVDFGKKYFHWEKTGAKVWIQDATEFINNLLECRKSGEKFVPDVKYSSFSVPKEFDLVCVDMYIGTGVPKKFDTMDFVRSVDKLLARKGIAVFNRLYGHHDRGKAKRFKDTLCRVFPKIKTVRPSANVMFLCGKGI